MFIITAGVSCPSAICAAHTQTTYNTAFMFNNHFRCLLSFSRLRCRATDYTQHCLIITAGVSCPSAIWAVEPQTTHNTAFMFNNHCRCLLPFSHLYYSNTDHTQHCFHAYQSLQISPALQPCVLLKHRPHATLTPCYSSLQSPPALRPFMLSERVGNNVGLSVPSHSWSLQQPVANTSSVPAGSVLHSSGKGLGCHVFGLTYSGPRLPQQACLLGLCWAPVRNRVGVRRVNF